MNRTYLVSALAITAILATSVVATAAGNGPGRGHDGARGDRQGAGFEMMDTNADGTVTMEEIQAAAAKRFADTDTNGDGKLSAEEIAAQAEAKMAEIRAKRMETRIEAMLKRQDADGDGQLTLQEMQDTERAARFFDRFDTDKDGSVTKAEFDDARDKHRAERGDRQAKRKQMRGGEGKGDN